jgi:UDP-N-acetylmuramoyl-L-alanyl-D-glutamate--2,6-diaminopimelate ligase
MGEYLKAKLLLFSKPELQYVVVNTDDKNSRHFLSVTGRKVKQWAFSSTGRQVESIENVTAESIEYSLSGLKFLVNWRSEQVLVQTKIVGDFNLDNILAVITVLLAEGLILKSIVHKINKLVPVKGRMECFGGVERPFVFVDFAHTPDALEKVLQGLRKHCKHTLYLVFGCGGNRDKGKRVEMGAIAEKYADQVIITDDNPRFEDPAQIVGDIVKGFFGNKHAVLQDREEAIQMAIQQARKTDCVVIAGKGHEEYQEIKGIKQFFSDQEVVRRALLNWVDQT